MGKYLGRGHEIWSVPRRFMRHDQNSGNKHVIVWPMKDVTFFAHFCFLYVLAPKVMWAQGRTAFPDWLISTHPAQHSSAFAMVFNGIAHRKPDRSVRNNHCHHLIMFQLLNDKFVFLSGFWKFWKLVQFNLLG